MKNTTLFKLTSRFLIWFKMSIDLQKLRVIQSYFIPVKRVDLGEEIQHELDEAVPTFAYLKAWYRHEQGNSIEFGLNDEYLYVISRIKRGGTRKMSDFLEDVRKLRSEYAKLTGIDSIRQTWENLRCGTPSDVYVNVIKCKEEGCEIEVECTPILYRILTQLEPTEEPNAALIQDSRICCERFLKTVFSAALAGTSLSAKTTTLTKTYVEFLINDAMHRQIHEKLEDMLDNATAEVLIFGYMGTIFVKKLQDLKQKGVTIKIITGNIGAIRQDVMRKEKEKAMEELVKMLTKANISSKPDFHGRAVIVDNKALIGSMDLDSYSMTGARIEFATYTEDPEIVRTLRVYFEHTFTQ